MTPRARRIWGGILLAIVGFSSAVASGFATYCIVASTGIGGLAPRIGPTGCEAYLTGVSALLTPTIAAIAAYIAYQQHQTARTKLRHDLYERRAGILRGVLVALAPVFHDGRVAGDVIPELMSSSTRSSANISTTSTEGRLYVCASAPVRGPLGWTGPHASGRRAHRAPRLADGAADRAAPAVPRLSAGRRGRVRGERVRDF